jgi:hypothetical protein
LSRVSKRRRPFTPADWTTPKSRRQICATLADLEAKTNALAELLDTLPAHPLGIEIEVAWNDQTSTLPATAWGELRDGLRQLQHMIGVADAHFPERRNAGALTVPAVSKCS